MASSPSRLLLHPLSAPIAQSAPWFRPGDVLFIPQRAGGATLITPPTLMDLFDHIVPLSPYQDYSAYEASLFDMKRCDRLTSSKTSPPCSTCRRKRPHPPCYLHEEREPGYYNPNHLPAILITRESIATSLRRWRKTARRSLSEVARAYCEMPAIEQRAPERTGGLTRTLTPASMRRVITMLERGASGYRDPGYVMGLMSLYRRPLSDLIVSHTTMAEFILRNEHHGTKTKPGHVDFLSVPKDLIIPDPDPIEGFTVTVREQLSANLALFLESVYHDHLRFREQTKKIGLEKGSAVLTAADVERIKGDARQEFKEQLIREGRWIDESSSTPQPASPTKKEDVSDAATIPSAAGFIAHPTVPIDFEPDAEEVADMMEQDPRFT